jgi:hypothetical protein
VTVGTEVEVEEGVGLGTGVEVGGGVDVGSTTRIEALY